MKKVIGVVLILILVAQFNVSLAASKTELQNEQTEIDEQIEATEKELEEIESKKSETLKEVETLINQISAYEIELDELDTQIQELEDKIEETEKSIEEKEAEYNKEQELLDNILITMYEEGDTTYLDVLLNSTDILDFLSKYYVVSEITESNTQLLESISKQKAEIEEQKETLETQKSELDTAKSTKEAKYTELKNAQTTKTKYVNQLSADEKEAQEQLEQFEKDKREIAAQLKKIAEEEAKKAASQGNSTTNITSTPSSSGYIFPLAGKTKKNITTGYMGYSNPAMGNHTGVDVAIAAGTQVLAVKDGTVVTSTALRTTSGAYRSYGEYIVINHGDGTMTLYAHMLSGSRRVSVGDKVKQGQVIGLVGSTGNSTGNHLHFEVRINGSPVNPTPYLP